MNESIHYINMLVMAEVLLGEHLFAHFLMHRENYLPRLCGSSILCLLAAYCFPVPLDTPASIVPYGTFMYVSIFVISAAALLFCYEEDALSIIFCALTGYTVHQTASALNDIFGILTVHSKAAYLITLAAAMAGCYAAFSGNIRKAGKIRIDNRKMMFLTGMVLLVEVVFGLVYRAGAFQSGRSEYQSLFGCYNAIC